MNSPPPACPMCCCSDEELRILRGEAELDEANISAAAAGESDEDSELLTGEDSEPTGGRGFGGDDLIIGRDAAGKDMQQQRQQMMMGPKGGRGGGGGGMMGAGEVSEGRPNALLAASGPLRLLPHCGSRAAASRGAVQSSHIHSAAV